MLTLDHAVNAHFLVDAVKILLAYITNLNYFACIDCFSWVHRRSYRLLLCTIYRLKEVCCKLCLADFTVLSFTKDIIDKDDETIDFTDSWLSLSTDHSFCMLVWGGGPWHFWSAALSIICHMTI